MKEKYFEINSIDSQARQFMNQITPFSKKHKWLLDVNSSALIIIDMQSYFLEEYSNAFIPSSKAIIPRIKKLQETFLSHNLLVIQTKHINEIKNAGQMKKWWKELITNNSPLSAITNDLLDERTIVLNKTQYDAFFETDLYPILKQKGINQVIITGVMAHLCCETTARSAFVRGFEVFFVVDATAAYNRLFHLSTLINISHGFATPVLTQEILSSLRMRYE